MQDEPQSSGRGERMRQAAVWFGRFRSGTGDLAARHDQHFADALPAGLDLQQRALEQVWADPALDVYDKD